MTCYRPLQAFRTPTGAVFSALRRHDIIGDLELPCGQCIGCRLRRAQDWSLRIMHEAASWSSSCFVTLTYARDALPPEGSLDHGDFQRFMKRLRKRKSPVRFYMCGEYGPLNARPHYHACLFNVDFRADRVPAGKSEAGAVFYTSALLEQLWTHGNVSVQDLTRETAGYCARYIMKKALGKGSLHAMDFLDDDGVVHFRKPEYSACSLKPGIGAEWFAKYGADVFAHDYAISDGRKYAPPKYYDKLLRRSGDLVLDQVEYSRQLKSKVGQADRTAERLAVREVVHLAKVRSLERTDQ